MTTNAKKTIQKLHAIADDESSSVEQIQAALAKAEKIMKDHSLNLDDLKDEADSGGIVRSVWTKNQKKLPAVEYVAHSISLLTETRGYVERGDVSSLVFMGFSVDVEYAIYLVDLCHNAMDRAWKEYMDTMQYLSIPVSARPKERIDFMRGMARALTDSVKQATSERRVHQNMNTVTTGTDLVIAKRTMISAALEREGLTIASSRRRGSVKVGMQAYTAGIAAGQRTTITKGIGVDA